MPAGSTDFIVRPYAEADHRDLVMLLGRVWPHKRDIERHVRERWWWRWLPPPVLLVEEAGRPGPVGLCAYVPFQVRSAGREIPAAWFVDFFVRPDFQGRGLGRRLADYVQDRFALTASLSQTAAAYRVFRKLGWSERHRVTLFMHPLPWPGLFRTRTRGRRVTVNAVDAALSAPADLDALWERLRDQYGSLAVRTSAHLLRRYSALGSRHYTLLRAYDGQCCTGYMVVRAVLPMSGAGRPRDGLIVDYLVAPDDTATFSLLLSTAVSQMAAIGARRVSMLTTVPAHARVLRRRGFLSPDTPVLGRALLGNVKWLTYHATTDAAQVDPGRWFLTLGDCDLDDVWYQD